MNKPSTLHHRLPLETLLRVTFDRNFGAVLVCVCVCVCVCGGVEELKAGYGRKKKNDFSRVSPLSGRIKEFWGEWSVYRMV